MTPKELRNRLFKPLHPVARRLEILNGEGYTRDAGILWAAYKAGSFSLPEELTQEQFVVAIGQYLASFQNRWIIDDYNKNYDATGGKGPVAIALTNAAELIVDAQFGFFKWATKRNILRSAASFLNMIKNSSKTGICLVRAQKDKRTLCDHLKHYDLLYYVGKSAENEYLYSIRGRGS